MPYTIFDAQSNQLIDEKVYGEKFLKFLYPAKKRNNFLEFWIFLFIARLPLTSYLYGLIQKLKFSKRKIRPFIKSYKIESEEFEKKIEEFTSFNDFFIRKLKPSCRPIDSDPNILIKPADGRYLVYPHLEKHAFVDVKGQKLNLEELIQEKLPWEGSTCAVMIRLAPVDYHRFHFPVSCEVLSCEKLGGSLFSVNPIAIRKNISYLFRNKRSVTKLYNPKLRTFYMVEVGATHVGSIIQKGYGKQVLKGEEKGYFEFGGSFIILLMENRHLAFDEKIEEMSLKGIETLGRFGEPLIRILK